MRALRFPLPAPADAPLPWVIEAERERLRRDADSQPRLEVPARWPPDERSEPTAVPPSNGPSPGSTVIVIPL
jgi:hypothetical protein